MPDLHGWEGIIFGMGTMAVLGFAVALWIRWEDRHKHPPSTPAPRR